MIINLQHKKDLITLDFNLKQIRYIYTTNTLGYINPRNIKFIDLSNNDILGYEYLFKNDLKLFFECIKEDIKNNLNVDLNIKLMELI